MQSVAVRFNFYHQIVMESKLKIEFYFLGLIRSKCSSFKNINCFEILKFELIAYKTLFIFIKKSFFGM